MSNKDMEKINELLRSLIESADKGTVDKDYGTQGLQIVLRHISVLVNKERG